MTAPVLIVGGNSRAARSFRALMSRLHIQTKVLVRSPGPALGGETHIVTDSYFDPPRHGFDGVGAVVNFVGAVSQPSEVDLIRLNSEGPAHLAGLARAAGAAAFVQLSSLSIFGGATDIDHNTVPAPKSPYGRSKLAAEKQILPLAKRDFSVILARAPIIYGPEGGGKLSQLIRLWNVARILPAPHRLEPRSMVHVDNLALGILAAIERGETGVTYPCDPEPFDLARLRNAIQHATGRRIRLQTMPPPFFAILAKIAPAVYESLYARSLVATESRSPLPAEAKSMDTCLRDLVRAELKRIADA